MSESCPSIESFPDFVGLVVLRADHVRREAHRPFDLGRRSGGFRRRHRRIQEESSRMVSGASAATETFDVLRLVSTERS